MVEQVIGILGAGGQAREMAEYAGATVAFWAVDRAYEPDGVERVDLAEPPADCVGLPVVVGVGAPGLKRRMVAEWPGNRYASIVTPMSRVAQTARVGEGAVIAPFAAIMGGVTIGAHVLVNTAAVVAHDSTVEDFVTISPRVVIGGNCRIEAGAFIGIGATIRDNIRIGQGAVVGAGAVVVSDVAAFEVVVGVPARGIRVAEDWLAEI